MKLIILGICYYSTANIDIELTEKGCTPDPNDPNDDSCDISSAAWFADNTQGKCNEFALSIGTLTCTVYKLGGYVIYVGNTCNR